MAPRRTFAAVSLIVAAAAATACSDSEDSDDTMPPIATDASATTQPSATTVAPTSSPPTTTPASTTGPATSVGPTTTDAAPTTTRPTTASPTTAAPGTTSSAPASGSVGLGADGLGTAAFGDDAETVIAATTNAVGAPTRDGGWVDPLTIGGGCPGDRYRSVSWNDLTLEFSDESGQRRFIGYVYGSTSGVTPQPAGLATARDVGAGSTVADLVDAYPQVSTIPGEAGLTDPRYAVGDQFEGTLTGLEDEDVVLSVEAGMHCGG